MKPREAPRPFLPCPFCLQWSSQVDCSQTGKEVCRNSTFRPRRAPLLAPWASVSQELPTFGPVSQSLRTVFELLLGTSSARAVDALQGRLLCSPNSTGQSNEGIF